MERDGVVAPKAHRASRMKKKKAPPQKQAVNAPGSMARRLRFAAERAEKRAPNPTAPADRSGGDSAAPRIVAVVGPPKTGKSTVIRNLVRHYSKRNIKAVTGPVTIVTGRKRRVTFVEVGADLPSMIDAAKVADLVLLTIDASYGFEMETFEFLNVAAAHGLPKIIGVLTHIDGLRDGKQVQVAKKRFKDRFWAELYNGAKLFYFSGITTTGDYLKREVLNLARFISVSKFPVIRWRNEHPYVLADRVEDVTPPDAQEGSDRTVVAFGYVRGAPLRVPDAGWRVHVPGVGDLIAKSVNVMRDPCPPPDAEVMAEETNAPTQEGDAKATKKKRRVGERERLVYAPMSPEVDGIAYDRDAVYIDLQKEDIRFSAIPAHDADSIPHTGNEMAVGPEGAHEVDSDASSEGEGETMVKNLQKTAVGIDERMRGASLQLVTGGKSIVCETVEDGRRRRRVVFNGGAEQEDASDDEVDESDVSEESSGDESGPESSAGDDEDDEGDEDDVEDGSDDDSEDSSEHGSGEAQVKEKASPKARLSSAGSDWAGGSTSAPESSLEESSGEDDTGSEALDKESEMLMRWKSKMLDNAASRLRSAASPSRRLVEYIYGDEDSNAKRLGNAMNEEDDLFKPKASSEFADVSRLLPDQVFDWLSSTFACRRLRRARFGTGRSATADSGGSSDEGSNVSGSLGDGSILNGDFEDLEAGGDDTPEAPKQGDGGFGESPSAGKGSKWNVLKRSSRQTANSDESSDDEDGHDRDRGSEVQGGAGGRKMSRQAVRAAADYAPDERKLERARLDALRKEELRGLNRTGRIELEGILPGNYVRMELNAVPVEFIRHFDPNRPVVVGGLKSMADEGMTYLRARVRRHRFKRGVLKSSDPIVFSIGWRRVQSVAIYDTEDQGGRRRFLKYTPEYLHCNTTFWGPSVAPGSGIIMCQSLGRDRAGFRIAGTGVITEVDASFKVVKKLKLVGEPYKVHQNTAFIKGMFNSELEVSKFIGAGVRTVSGVRGSIKKPVSERAAKDGKHKSREMGQAGPGAFRAGFEDKILLSDVVFLRAWVPVGAPQFCSVATTLLEKSDKAAAEWRMRTVREVREQRKLPIPNKDDSHYLEIDRKDPMFAPFKISKALEGALPFASKPKNFASLHSKPKPSTNSRRKAILSNARAVVMDPEEKREAAVMNAVYSVRRDRAEKRKVASTKRLEKLKKDTAQAEAKRGKQVAETKKRKYAVEGAAAARAAKRSKRDSAK